MAGTNSRSGDSALGNDELEKRVDLRMASERSGASTYGGSPSPSASPKSTTAHLRIMRPAVWRVRRKSKLTTNDSATHTGLADLRRQGGSPVLYSAEPKQHSLPEIEDPDEDGLGSSMSRLPFWNCSSKGAGVSSPSLIRIINVA
jgi:hypothetical protein